MKILLIEDNPGDACLIQEMLKEEAYTLLGDVVECIHVSRLFEAINFLVRQTVDLVLVDLSLPDSLGLDTFKQLNNLIPQIPIIVLTVTENDSTGMSALQFGAQDYLAKQEITSHILWHSIRYAIERKRSELDLQESENRFRSAFNTAAIGMAIVSTEGRWLRVNRALCQIIGYSEEEMLQIDFQRLTYPDDLAEDLHFFNQMLRGEIDTYQMEKRYFHKQGHVVWIMLSVSCVRNANREMIYFVSQIQDISQRKHAEEYVRQHQLELAHVARINSMGELASALAHELNQPLAAIVNYTRGCIRRMENGQFKIEELLYAMRQAAQQAERAGEIIHRIKNFVRKGTLYYKEMNIMELIKGAIKWLDHEVREIGVTVRYELNDDLPTIECDQVQIEQVIINLIKNSLEAMQEAKTLKPTIIIKAHLLHERWVVVTVIDNGPGFPEEVAHRLLDPYVTTKAKGMGMGLSICRTIIEAHGGRLLASLNSEGGSSLQFMLPIESNQSNSLPEEAVSFTDL